MSTIYSLFIRYMLLNKNKKNFKNIYQKQVKERLKNSLLIYKKAIKDQPGETKVFQKQKLYLFPSKDSVEINFKIVGAGWSAIVHDLQDKPVLLVKDEEMDFLYGYAMLVKSK